MLELEHIKQLMGRSFIVAGVSQKMLKQNKKCIMGGVGSRWVKCNTTIFFWQKKLSNFLNFNI